MEKKILLAVDDSIHSMDAVRYAVNMSLPVKDVTYTLCHVQPGISGFLLDQARTDFKAQAELKKITRKNAEKAHGMLQRYKEWIVGMGIAEKRIDLVTAPRALGLTKDILLCAERGLYDAIVAGRRGLSRIQKTFMGSTSASLLSHSMVVPVWIVDGKVESTRIMVAVDGSENSLRAVDHLSFMVAGNPEIKVTLFHVVPKFRDYQTFNIKEEESVLHQIIARHERQYIQDFFVRARQRLNDAGIKNSQIEVKVTRPSLHLGKRIMDEARKGNYGTVVIGRRGVSKAFFLGSASKYVIDRISGRAIWLVS
ncbi:MAG: universal stress protein [Deltaproteobacteria bacterium]|nr:universal stress protein [Deltaproteobacteria bacterium]